MALFVVLFVGHEADAVPSLAVLAHAWVNDVLPTSLLLPPFPQDSVELDLRTSYTFAISVSLTDLVPNFLYRGIESNLRWNRYGRSR